MSDLLSKLELDDAIRGFVETAFPSEALQQQQVVREVVNRSGGINREAILPFLPDLVAKWSPTVTAGEYVPQVSQLGRLVAHASTPPSSGNCVVTLSILPPGAGLTTIGTVTILNGQSTGETSLTHEVPAGAWLFASVTTANGASGVSIAATRRLL